MLITIVEYAKRQGRKPEVARHMAGRGGFQTAQKLGRDWFVEEAEPWPDRRRVGESAGWRCAGVRTIQLCPFCGGKAGWVFDGGQAASYEAIRCQMCGASSSRFYFDRMHPRSEARKKALTAWNKRAADPGISLCVDAEIVCEF